MTWRATLPIPRRLAASPQKKIQRVESVTCLATLPFRAASCGFAAERRHSYIEGSGPGYSCGFAATLTGVRTATSYGSTPKCSAHHSSVLSERSCSRHTHPARGGSIQRDRIHRRASQRCCDSSCILARSVRTRRLSLRHPVAESRLVATWCEV